MPPFKDYIGKQFGDLMAVSAEIVDGKTKWTCRCKCGNTTIVSLANLLGGTKSCGCRRKPHGYSCIDKKRTASRTYKSYISMKSRCLNPNSPDYERYGGAGVIICEEWLNSFRAFLKDMGERPLNMSLDRIDPYGNYEPSNCRWADSKMQRINRRSNYVMPTL